MAKTTKPAPEAPKPDPVPTDPNDQPTGAHSRR